MNDNVEIIRSNKGGMKIIHRGYMYTVHKKRQGGGIRWRCTQRSLHCKGSISTGSGPPSVNMPHNHIPDPHSVALARCRQIEELPDINSLLETEYDETTDTMPLQQRIGLNVSQQVQVRNSCESRLQSQPLSPTKLKVTRQNSKPASVTPKVIEIPINAPAEEVCLRWNSHHSNMQTAFPYLLEKEQYVDVTLIAEGKTIKCHRMILSSCSAYFEEVLSTITPAQHPVIILNNTPFWIIKALIDFMYIGEVNIDQNKLPDLIDVAELLKVKGLAGKGNNDGDKKVNQTLKKENTTSKPQAIKRTPIRIPSPTNTKIEEMPINDPLDLLEPKFQEDPDSPLQVKDNKLQPKKLLSKKFKKRKLVEHEIAPPPLFPMRRGTRSRPNVKIPKYYDYEDIVKSTVSQSSDIQPFSPIVNIKTEPADEDDGFSNRNIEMDDLQSFDDSGEKENENEPKISNNSDSEPPFFKIKIKSFSSLSDHVNPSGETVTDFDPLSNDTSCSNPEFSGQDEQFGCDNPGDINLDENMEDSFKEPFKEIE